jgi:hypothetical protein
MNPYMLLPPSGQTETRSFFGTASFVIQGWRRYLFHGAELVADRECVLGSAVAYKLQARLKYCVMLHVYRRSAMGEYNFVVSTKAMGINRGRNV